MRPNENRATSSFARAKASAGTRTGKRFLSVLLAVCMVLTLLPAITLTAAAAATITVTSAADAGDGTLRAAIATAAADTGNAYTITFASSVTKITLASTLEIPGNTFGDTNPLTIDGAGKVTIDGGDTYDGSAGSGHSGVRIMTVNSNNTVTLNGLALQNGYSANDVEGGAVYNNGFLTAEGCTFRGNTTANSSGGAVVNYGTLTAEGCTFTGNTAANSSGGAVYNAGTLTAEGCTFTGNAANSSGGAVMNDTGTATLANSTFTGNAAGTNGGAIYNNDGNVYLVNSILTGNTAQIDGGDVWTYGDATTDTYAYYSLVGSVYNNNGGGTGLAAFSGMATGTALAAAEDVFATVSGGKAVADADGLFSIKAGGAADGKGAFVWHNADWTAVAYSADKAGTGKAAVRGEASAATEMVAKDQRGAEIGDTADVGAVLASTAYDLWVGGVQVTSANASDVLGDADTGATVTYNAESNTLTLNNANITGYYKTTVYEGTKYMNYYGVYGANLGDDFTIALVGDNSITRSGTADEGERLYYNYGVRIIGNLEITAAAAASLNIRAAAGSGSNNNTAYGVFNINGSISSPQSSTLKITGQAAVTADAQDGDLTYAVYAYTLRVEDDASLEAKSNVHAVYSYTDPYAANSIQAALTKTGALSAEGWKYEYRSIVNSGNDYALRAEFTALEPGIYPGTPSGTLQKGKPSTATVALDPVLLSETISAAWCNAQGAAASAPFGLSLSLANNVLTVSGTPTGYGDVHIKFTAGEYSAMTTLRVLPESGMTALYLQGVDLLASSSAANSLSALGASYSDSADGGVLTLNNYSYSNGGLYAEDASTDDAFNYYALYAGGAPLTIALEGSNTMTWTKTPADCMSDYMIYSGEPLTIQGDGSLALSVSLSAETSGIYAYSGLTVSGGATVTAAASAAGEHYSRGLMTPSLTMKDASRLAVSAGSDGFCGRGSQAIPVTLDAGSSFTATGGVRAFLSENQLSLSDGVKMAGATGATAALQPVSYSGNDTTCLLPDGSVAKHIAFQIPPETMSETDKTVSVSISTAGGAQSINLASLFTGVDAPVFGAPTVATGGTVAFTTDPAVSNNVLTFTSAAGTAGATAKITIPVTSFSHADFTATLTLTLADKTPVEISGVSAATGLVYDGSAQAGYTGTVSVTANAVSAGDLVYTYYVKDASAETYTSKTTEANSGAASEGGAPKNAGSYRLTISVPEDNTTYTGSTSVDFTIDHIDISDETRFNVDFPVDTVYNGQAQKQPVKVTDMLTGKDLTPDADYTLAYGADVVNAGAVEVTVTGAGNYTGTMDRSYKITPVTDNVTVKIVGNSASKVYDGTAQPVAGYTVKDISNALYTAADFTFNGDASASLTDAGTAYMDLTEPDFANMNGNFSNVIFDVTDGYTEITPRPVTFTGESKTVAPTGTEISLTTITTDGLVTGHVYKGLAYSAAGTTSGRYDGSFAGTVVIEDSSGADVTKNYNVAQVPGVLIITNKTIPTVSANLVTITYGETPTVTGTATYNGQTVSGTWGFTTTPPTDAGIYQDMLVIFEPTGDDADNYAPVTTAITLTIKKATPTGAPGYNLITKEGVTLINAGLNAGSISVPGSIVWVDMNGNSIRPDQTVVEVNVPYKWQFTPDDDHNYETISGTLVPYRTATEKLPDQNISIPYNTAESTIFRLELPTIAASLGTVVTWGFTEFTVNFMQSATNDGLVPLFAKYGAHTAADIGQTAVYDMVVLIKKSTSEEIAASLKVTFTLTATSSGGGGGGGGGTVAAPTVSDPQTSGNTTTVTTTVTPSTSGTASSVTVPGTTANSAVNSAIEAAEENNTAPVVEIEVGTPARADSIEVTLPSAALKTLSEKEDAQLVITSGVADVALDADALAAIAEQAGSNLTIVVTPVESSELNARQQAAIGDAPVFDVTVKSGSTVISDLGGGRISVTVPYELAEGQSAAGLVVYYLDDNGNLHPCTTSYNAATGMVTFRTDHLSKYVVMYDETAAWVNPFIDVAESDWFYGNVAYACENGLMTGTSATTFDPHGSTTRAMVATVLWRMEGSPEVEGMYADYADVAQGSWYENAIGWAAKNGILSGYGDGFMGPQDAITREQIAAVLYRYAEYKGYDLTATTDLSQFTDVGQISAWAVTPLSWANANGLVSGKGGGVLDPGGNAERCQVAAILQRFCEAFVK